MNEKETVRISKFLSLVLRHQPELIGIELDEQGWTNVPVLIQKVKEAGVSLDLDLLKHVVETNNKKRFAFTEDFGRIRASQGHSVEVELGYTAQTPPSVLYHGTHEKAVGSILKDGLEKRKRNHVHLSATIETAIQVGKRHGKPMVLEVSAAKMAAQGFKFYISDNGVWLTDNVPPEYLSLIDGK
ncbi:MAG: RNA 2'-phosphotransferase [Cytophagaceae bacterium]